MSSKTKVIDLTSDASDEETDYVARLVRATPKLTDEDWHPCMTTEEQSNSPHLLATATECASNIATAINQPAASEHSGQGRVEHCICECSVAAMATESFRDRLEYCVDGV